MKDPDLGWAGEPGWEYGLASTLLGGSLAILAGIGMVYNILLASHGRSIMNQTDARLQGIGTALILACAIGCLGFAFRLGFLGRGGLAVAGRALGLLASVMWLAFAIGQAFVLVPMW